MRRLLECALIAGSLLSVCDAQTLLDDVNFRSSALGGLHLYEVSFFSGYSSSAYPQTGGIALNNTTGAQNLGPDESFGASATVGLQRHRDNSDLAVMYSGTYTSMAHYSSLDAYNQSISITVSRMLTPRWTFTLTATGMDSTLAQFVLQPSNLSIISGVPATFDDLAAAFAVGQYSNAQAASMLTGAPVMQSPGRSLLEGNRVLSYTSNATLAYALSSRLRFHIGSLAAAGQTRQTGQDGVAPPSYVMPRSVGVNAGLGITYSLSPRTEVAASLEATRTVNHYQSTYVTTANASLGRKMGMHWFLRLQGGATEAEVTQQSFGAPKVRQLVGGGELGYQASTHTLVASYDRSASDTFGFAVGTLTSMTGAWNWRRPNSRWRLFANFGEQQTRNTGFTSLSGWQASGGISTNLSPHTMASVQYVYLSSKGTYLGTLSDLAIHSVRLSLGWSPQAIQH